MNLYKNIKAYNNLKNRKKKDILNDNGPKENIKQSLNMRILR